MSDWTPKVGDRVMVGEHGPYEVYALSGEDSEYVQIAIPTEAPRKFRSVCPDWLTPAPEPEPEEPPAPGALVRSSEGILLFRSTGDASRWYEVMTPGGGYWEWAEIPRPITVVLADPAEVETLRAEVDRFAERIDELERDYESAAYERDELQRRIERFEAYVTTPTVWEAVGSAGRRAFMRILRDES